MGKVNNPGIFHLDFPVTAVQAVARSGGFTEWASHEVSVIRQGSGQTTVKGSSGKNTVIKFDYDDFLKGKGLDKNVYIQANDVVIVH
jgi:protein involved in polysaccharide export with SLBB domain